MSAISSIGSNATPYDPTGKADAAKPAKVPAQASTTQVGTKDADHDGDVDGKGLDVNG